MQVEFKTDAPNERSGATMAALPATFEGIFRKHTRIPDTGVRDSAYPSLVYDEWAGVRANPTARVARRAEASARA